MSLLLFFWLAVAIGKSKDFLCSTAWARTKGFTPEQIKLFSFGRGGVWIGVGILCAVLPAIAIWNLVESPRTHRQPRTAAGAGVLSFGPVIEREMQDNTECLRLLDLDTGQTHGPVPIGGESDLPQSMDLWIRYVRVDGSLRVGGVISLDHLIVLPATSAEWDMAAEDLAKRLKLLHSRVVGRPTPAKELANRLSELPRTYLFRTQEGNEGVLQIVAFTHKLTGVKIRFKLVRPATVAASFGVETGE